MEQPSSTPTKRKPGRPAGVILSERFELLLSPEQLDWLNRLTEEQKCSAAEVVRRLLDAAREAEPPPAPGD